MLLLLSALAGSPAQAVEIEHETFTLDNGLEVILIPDDRLPKVAVDLWYDVGSYDDPTGRSGFAHLFEHLMFKGTGRVGEGEFDSTMEQAGGWNNASTADERTNYYDVAPSSALDLLLWLEADRMTSLDITQKKLDVEREVVRNEKRQNYEDRPYGEVWIAMPPALYSADNALHRPGIGNHEELLAASLEDVRSFYASYYTPRNAVLTVAGDFDPAEIKGEIQTLFGGLPDRPKAERSGPVITGKMAKTDVDLTDDVTLPMVLYIWHGPKAYSAGDAERDVLAHVLAGADDSRLTRRLVNEEQLAQDVSTGQYSNRWDSQFMISIMANPDADLAQIEAIVAEEIAALNGDKPPTQAEVDRAAANLEMSLLHGVETVLGKAEILQRYRMFVGRTDYLEEDLARYGKVSIDGVKAEAGKLTADSRLRMRVLPEGDEGEE